jgi:hypothetical protein
MGRTRQQDSHQRSKKADPIHEIPDHAAHGAAHRDGLDIRKVKPPVSLDKA